MTVPRLPTMSVPAPRPKLRKIALEEAYATKAGVKLDDSGNPDWAWFMDENALNRRYMDAVAPRLLDFDETRLQAMDESGIEYVVNSLTCPGIERILDAKEAQEAATACNDFLACQVKAHPDRFGGFASVAMHDPEVGAAELERCVNRLGFKGVLFNGFAQQGREDNLIYLDHPSYTPFWEAVTALDVPVYIHPRVSYQRLMYQGREELQGMVWGYAPETATHLLRIIYSGVFDRFPTAQVVIGHLGEAIPYQAWRIQHCFEHSPRNDKVELRLQDYLARNVWITTAGNYSTVALHCAMEAMGTDRIMFSVDYPFENMDEAADWIEACDISEDDRSKIAYGNAKRLLKL
jgi:predicted TIM-barrel fold metal-dependent hydrolase